MITNLKTVWGSILCAVGALTIVGSVTMYFDYREEVATIDALQSIGNSFERDMTKLFGGSGAGLNLNLRNDPNIRKSISGARNRVILVLLAGIAMSILGSWLLVEGNKES